MSVPASPVVRDPSPPLATRKRDSDADSFDARWTAWIERGRQQDLAAKHTLRMALLGAAVIGFLVALLFGRP